MMMSHFSTPNLYRLKSQVQFSRILEQYFRIFYLAALIDFRSRLYLLDHQLYMYMPRCCIPSSYVQCVTLSFKTLGCFSSGTSWVEVSCPLQSPSGEPSLLLQVSAGVNSVWALTKDGQVSQSCCCCCCCCCCS